MAEYAIPVTLRRRTADERAAYIAEKAPRIARRFGCTEEEARQLLAGVEAAGGVLVALPEALQAEALGSVAAGETVEQWRAQRSYAFILARLGEDPEFPDGVVAYVQLGDAEPVPVGEVRGRCCMYSGEASTLAGAVKKIAEMLGVEVIER